MVAVPGPAVLPVLSDAQLEQAEAPLDNVLSLTLPAVTLALSRAAVLGPLTRAAVLDVVQRPFVQYARAKGLGERAIPLMSVFDWLDPQKG